MELRRPLVHMASLKAKHISYARRKTGTSVIVHFGDSVEEILKSLPQAGFLFPNIQRSREADRATYFKRRCKLRMVSRHVVHALGVVRREKKEREAYRLFGAPFHGSLRLDEEPRNRLCR